MPDEITAFRPEQLRDKVTERIQASFVELIPEASWKQMVEEQIRYFTTKKQGWGSKDLSPLQMIIHDELVKRFKAKIVRYIDSPEMQLEWDHANNEYSPNMALKEILEGLVSQVVIAQHQGAVVEILQKIKQSMQH